jgi:asparagine synthetase B (glutamine-hydrolysing)
MCGLAALIWKSGRTPDNAGAVLKELEAGLIHRGPDETRVFRWRGIRRRSPAASDC